MLNVNCRNKGQQAGQDDHILQKLLKKTKDCPGCLKGLAKSTDQFIKTKI